jgi:hypothetical protein
MHVPGLMYLKNNFLYKKRRNLLNVSVEHNDVYFELRKDSVRLFLT